MDLRDVYLEEDLFPKLFTNYEERPYGILFYNEANRDSFDSNHAVIYKDKIDECLDIIGMKDKRKLTPRELSGGQQQRVAIARALVFDPKILFLDEPIGNLDSKTGFKIMELFRKINEKYNKTIIQVTHSEEAAEYGTSLVKLVDGQIKTVKPVSMTA